MAEDSGWDLISQVGSSLPFASRVVAAARTLHLASAEPLTFTDPPSAFSLLYDGARKAMTAVLARQGLRPTRAGGHLAVQEAVEAQLGPNAKVVVRPFRTLRRRRHESEYPSLGDPPVTQVEASEGLEDARAIAEAMKRLLPRLNPW
jgi:hypothetical protein